MEECRHCGASFDEETPYLEHLQEEHGDDLGAIEQRRISEELETNSGAPASVVYAAVGVGILLIGLVAYALFFTGGSGPSAGGSGSLGDLADSGNQSIIDDVETIPSSGNQHVSNPSYESLPPTGGPHTGATVGAGFYEQTPSLGALVHTLEHGAVVVYYDDSRMSEAAEQDLKEWASTYTGTWASVVVVPHPEENPEHAYVLTAWEKKYTMDEYDPDVVTAFAAEYLGRGPENPVR